MKTMQELENKLKELKKEVEITEKEIETLKNVKFIPETTSELKKLVSDKRISLADIDVSKVYDFDFLFDNSTRKNWEGIETWDVSHVKCMQFTFGGTYFDGDLSNWDLKSLKFAKNMFAFCNFKGKLPKNFNEVMVRLYTGLEIEEEQENENNC